ncbi:MAG TPA: pyruvate kinase [Candidatus Latescibacteria bacterium]|nr:pyruvate kinase [Candidatus Latescibacterota bacterium]
MIRRTKIVCTIGPQTASIEQLRALVDAGMNVARVNFSHGTHEGHRSVIRAVRALRGQYGEPVGVLADLSGPKIRLGKLPGGSCRVETGQTIILTCDTGGNCGDRFPINYPYLSEDVKVGDSVVMNDGDVSARVTEVRGGDVVCVVEDGGMLGDNKGVNFPDSALRVDAITEKDRRDVRFALEEKVDFLALSFVRRPEDIVSLRGLVAGGSHTPRIIAKIEKREALENFDAILAEADGIMVARGDLGLETELARVPMVQKDLIARARAAGKPVITATQMLESMIVNPVPTRAEVADVANAILDGTDAVMLSGETAVGRFPVDTVRMMARIAAATEAAHQPANGFRRNADRGVLNPSEAIGQSTAQMAWDLHVVAIVVCTDSGKTGRVVSRFRPAIPIVGATPNEEVARQLTLSWGVVPALLEPITSTDELIAHAFATVKGTGIAKDGDQVVITAGIPFGGGGMTNLLLVQQIA